ncbi:MAG: hypothetical protein GQ477_06465 [Nanohaloarchaea archaeon]|nr:hypothetical protein [Candidatus Nanohaloarchaea archaeon]
MVFIIFISPHIANAEESTCIYLFYGDGCSHCAKVDLFINQLEVEYPDIAIHKFEIYNNRTNALILTDYFDIYNIPNKQRGIPVIFISDKYLIGDTPIIKNLENEINDNPSAQCPQSEDINATGIIDATSPLEKLKTLSIVTVIGAAIVDSINPCAIAVLLLLLGALLTTGNRKKALKAGFAFTISIYIAYFLFGLGLFSALQITGISYWFYQVIGYLAILIGLVNIKDYLWYGAGGFVMEMPRRWRPALKNILGKITTPAGAFLSGFVVCLFELPCTGGPYILILGLLAERTTQMAAIPILLLYNLFFILPLIIITLLIYLGYTNIENATKWKDENIRKLHLVAGIIMLILGTIILLGLA